jgi:hypothetical protein
MKGASTLGLVTIGNITNINRSPSPVPKVVISKTKENQVKSQEKASMKSSKLPTTTINKSKLSPRKGPKNATQAAKVTKKIAQSTVVKPVPVAATKTAK